MFKFLKKKRRVAEAESPDIVGPYITELLFEDKPSLNIDNFAEIIQDYCGSIDVLSFDDSTMHIAFKELMVTFKEGKIPYQMTATVIEKKNSNQLRASLNQSWTWKNAEETVDKCKYSIVITDLMGTGLDYKTRIKMYQQFLYVICEKTNCLAIHFVKSQNIISPRQYQEYSPREEGYDILCGILNIRLFKLAGTDEEILMDTVGLGFFGLIDLQCHFKRVDINQIAQLLYSYAKYLYSNGDVINDGETVEGISYEEKWRCNHELSILPPERIVLDICPYKNHAGSR